MATEIERKYLVRSLAGLALPPGEAIDQGYIATDPVTVRVRTKGPKAFLTIKCAPPESTVEMNAIVRDEFEYEIPVAEALQLLDRCKSRLQKVRHRFPNGIELDIFQGRHAGLVLAEFESTDGAPAPAMDGLEMTEVTADARYSNSWISIHGIPPEK